MSPETIKRLFPNASESLLAANAILPASPTLIDCVKEARKEAVKPKRAREPNRTEKEYRLILDRDYPDCEIRWEAYVLRLANRVTYNPDFSIQYPSGELEFVEVKGSYIYPKALQKLRVAAEYFNHRFVFAQKLKTGWNVTEIAGRWQRERAQQNTA